jgi:hypothetical protein
MPDLPLDAVDLHPHQDCLAESRGLRRRVGVPFRQRRVWGSRIGATRDHVITPSPGVTGKSTVIKVVWLRLRGSTVAEMVSGGWPQVISSLKTLLETGDPLPA